MEILLFNKLSLRLERLIFKQCEVNTRKSFYKHHLTSTHSNSIFMYLKTQVGC